MVVESIQKGSAAEKADIRAGDILLSWNRMGANHTIESPFDLFVVEADQAPRSPVSLEGRRGETKLVWELGPQVWGIEARPNFSPELFALYHSGQEMEGAGKIVDAAKYWQVDVNNAVEPAQRPSWLSSWLSFHAAARLAQAEKWTEADAAYEEAIQRAHGSNPDITTQLLNSWGEAHKERDDWAAAERYYLLAVENQRQAARTDNLISARALSNAGYVNFTSGNLPAAEKYYTEALNIKKELAPHSRTFASSLMNLANAVSQLGEYLQAEKYYAEALGIYEELLPRSIEVARVLNNLGINASSYGDLAKAERYYRQALDIVEKLSKSGSPMEATLDQNLASLAISRHDLDKAEAYATRSLAIRTKLNPGLAVASTLNNLGVIAMMRENFSKAEKYYLESIAITQKLAPTSLELVSVLANLGDCRHQMGDLIHAEEYLKKSLEIATGVVPNSDYVGDILSLLGDLAKDQNDFNKAEVYYRKSLEIREGIQPGSWLHAEALAKLASVMLQNNKLDLAAELYLQALNALDSQIAHLGGADDLRSNFRATYESYYKEYAGLLMMRKEPESAFYTLERMRARTLLEMLTAAKLDIRKGADPALLSEERSLEDRLRGKINRRLQLLNDEPNKTQLESLDREISALLQQHSELQARIRAENPSYAGLAEPQPLGTAAIQHLLPQNTLLLEYSLGESRSYVFALTSNSLTSYELPKRTEIETKAQLFYRLLTERSRTVQAESVGQRHARLTKADAQLGRVALELSRMLLKPVESELQQRRLLVVSDGALQYVPFAVLPTPASFTLKNAQPLILKHEIINLPSASALAFLQKRHMPGREVAIFADPVFNSGDLRVKSAALNQISKPSPSANSISLEADSVSHNSFSRSLADMNLEESGEVHLPRLAFTRDEAKAIAAFVPPESRMEALGFDATRDRAMSRELANYRVVHFATHALINNIHPELSGLVLSLVNQKGESVDGFLDLQDIYNLDLPADLVVLSACQTALGKQIKGEGMIGLTRGFMYAGASRVLATLWKVDDFATALFMAHFYKALERDKMAPAQALRQAQLALRKSRSVSAPYFWAGFVLQGDWQ